MLIYIGGSTTTVRNNEYFRHMDNCLSSYYYIHYIRKSSERLHFAYFYNQVLKKKKKNLFIDSGAFSAWTKKYRIDLDLYCSWLHNHKDGITTYANLDVIDSAKKTWDNQKYMESNDLNPLPVFHYGEDIKWLKKYINDYDHIGLGGMVPISNSKLVPWLDEIFSKYICDSRGRAKIKVHGFGVSGFVLIHRYPWHSIDSTSWSFTSRSGSVTVPIIHNGLINYNIQPIDIVFSNRITRNVFYNKHINYLSSRKKENIVNYFKNHGFSLGLSKIRKENKNYIPKYNEKWIDQEKYIIEKIIKIGLTNDRIIRDCANILYYNNLGRYLAKKDLKFRYMKYVLPTLI